MRKDKLLAFYQANPKRAVLYAVVLAILLMLLVSGIVFAVQDAKAAARLEAERVAIQAQEEEKTRLAVEAEKAAAIEAERVAIKAQEEEKARLAAEVEKAAAIEAERVAEAKRIADAKAAADATAKAKAKAAAVSTNPTQGGYCFIFPAYIRPYLSSGSLPDSATVDGHKHVCNKLDDGGKDKPSKKASEENKKGHGGGACYDWDETPSINACYPVKVYGNLLNNFLKNNPPESVKKHGLIFKKS
ncbi:MAG: hypothetical protein WA087_01300 [Candidatus Saccharimonadales bacterium]